MGCSFHTGERHNEPIRQPVVERAMSSGDRYVGGIVTRAWKTRSGLNPGSPPEAGAGSVQARAWPAAGPAQPRSRPRPWRSAPAGSSGRRSRQGWPDGARCRRRPRDRHHGAAVNSAATMMATLRTKSVTVIEHDFVKARNRSRCPRGSPAITCTATIHPSPPRYREQPASAANCRASGAATRRSPAHRQLDPPPVGPHERQRHEIRQRRRQDDEHSSEKHQHRLTMVADQHLVQRHDRTPSLRGYSTGNCSRSEPQIAVSSACAASASTARPAARTAERSSPSPEDAAAGRDPARAA